ncbi:MAG: CRTAC1 family protein, partial [Caldilineae bacterium]
MPGLVSRGLAGLLFLLMLSACVQPTPVSHRTSAPGPQPEPAATPVPTATPARLVPVRGDAVPLAAGTCSGRFLPHTLEHTTTVPGGDTVRMFEANGSGVALGDLDGDGDIDIVLANHAGPNSILWNEGHLRFRREPLGEGDARAAAIVDLDGDGLLDILFTRRVSAPNLWHNEGGGRFARRVLPGVTAPLYAMDIADLDGDGDLDLAGATYDAALLTEFGQEFLQSGKGGVYVYENRGGSFVGQRLAVSAQALALLLLDINDDGRPDILVGNDFAVPDYAWVQTREGWQPASFEVMSYSTMSMDAGDIDNNGRPEIFTTDMMPYDRSAETEAAWQPVIDDMMADPHPEEDPQVMANVLLMDTGVIGYQDVAGPRGVDASGWSWSAKFGDLDQDGYLDLYVVNGFIEQTVFAHLPRHELVEENQVFRNLGDGYFRPEPAWGLGSKLSGRGMSMADLDNDGDLDIVVNNLRGPAQLFENQLCGGDSLEVDLRWPASRNTRAIGTRVILHTSRGDLHRRVQAVSGYLSGNPQRIHLGFPAG